MVRGTELTSNAILTFAAERGIEWHYIAPGKPMQNGFVESFIHRRRPWRNFEAVEYATLEWVDWFNNRRLLEPIGNIPPAEAEANFYAALETADMAA